MTDIQQTRSQSELLFFNNVRYFIIMFVILQHVALIYRVYDAEMDVTQSLCKIIISLTDIFMMPVLFFAAGFFALSSIQRRGPADFIKSKLNRLGIPLLIGVTMIVPVATYFMSCIKALNNGISPMKYWDYWIMIMKSAVTFHTGFITSQNQFSHKHLWFLSVLLSIFFIFCLLYMIKKKLTDDYPNQNTMSASSDKSILIMMLLVGVATTLGFFTVKLFMRWGYHAILIASIIHFEISRLVYQGIYFALGVYAYSRRWFSGGKAPGPLVVWAPVCVLLLIIQIFFLFNGSLELTVGMKFVFSLLRSFLCLSIFIVLLSLAYRFWNSPSSFDRKMGANSYTIYVIHYPLHAAFALMLLGLKINILVKFGIVYLATFFASYVISQHVIKPYPRLSVTGLVLVNIIMFIVI